MYLLQASSSGWDQPDLVGDVMIFFLIGLGGFIAFLFLIRLFGAWMLRIDEVIKEQKTTNDLLLKIYEGKKKESTGSEATSEDQIKPDKED